MKFIWALILLSFSSLLPATVIKTEIKGDSKKIYLDYNSDNKVDLIETYNKNDLVKKEQDLDYNGSYDEVTEYFSYTSDTAPIEIVKKNDRLIKIYRSEKLKKIITTSQLDADGDGKYEQVITNSEPLIQKKDNPCKGSAELIAGAFLNLSQNVDKSINRMSNGYYTGEAGYNVHKSCLDNWGAQVFPKALSVAKTSGLSCLSDLAQKNTAKDPRKPNGALNNLNNLNRLYQKSPVTIVCNELERDWSTSVAHASAAPTDVIKSLNVKHPYLSISPKDPKASTKPTEDEITELTKTIFHEQLHNLGIRHGEGVEYPYTCETCCLPDKKQDPKVTSSSCKICAGQYDVNNKKDTSYIQDLVVWSESSFQYERATKAIMKYQQENPGSQWGIIMQARTQGNFFSATGIEMAKILKSKFKTLSKEDEENLIKALAHENAPHVKAVSENAKVVASATIDYYFDNNPIKTLVNLEKNKAKLKAIVKTGKTGATDADKWTNESLYKDTLNILNAIFMKGYPDHVDEASSGRAYKLMKEIGID